MAIAADGAMVLEFRGRDRMVVSRVPDGPALPLDDQPLQDDRSNDVPLELVREDGVWRVLNCGDYVPD